MPGASPGAQYAPEPLNHCERRAQENLQVKPWRPRHGIAKVHPDHIVELDAASARNLPHPGDAGLGFEHAAPVPGLIRRQFVGNCGTRPHQRHLPFETH